MFNLLSKFIHFSLSLNCWSVQRQTNRALDFLPLSSHPFFWKSFVSFFFFSQQSLIQIHRLTFFPPSLVLRGKSSQKIWGYCFVLGDVPPVWLFYLRICPLVLWSQRVSECCVLQLAEGGLAQTSPLRINSLFAATDTNLQSAEFVCLVKRKKRENQRLPGEARCLSAVRRLSFRSPALIYQTKVEKHADSCVANRATPEPRVWFMERAYQACSATWKTGCW